jgi:hypothetical protein
MWAPGAPAPNPSAPGRAQHRASATVCFMAICVCMSRSRDFLQLFFFLFFPRTQFPSLARLSSMAGLGATGEGEGAVATGKRPLDAVAKPEAVPAEDGAQEKRARVEGGATGASGGGDAATAALQAALPLEKAVEATEAASGLKVCLDTTKVEVCWQVADEEAEDSSPIILW